MKLKHMNKRLYGCKIMNLWWGSYGQINKAYNLFCNCSLCFIR
jgi:hypothetical protein